LAGFEWKNKVTGLERLDGRGCRKDKSGTGVPNFRRFPNYRDTADDRISNLLEIANHAKNRLECRRVEKYGIRLTGRRVESSPVCCRAGHRI
jgi:hypothetical protein